MTQAEWINIAAVTGTPLFLGVIGWLHKQNKARWDSVTRQMKKARRMAKRAIAQHTDLRDRLVQIEQRLPPPSP